MEKRRGSQKNSTHIGQNLDLKLLLGGWSGLCLIFKLNYFYFSSLYFDIFASNYTKIPLTQFYFARITLYIYFLMLMQVLELQCPEVFGGQLVEQYL